MSKSKVATVFELLHGRYGNQQWWPAETAFEMMAGAILTQNTSWTGVESAIANLKQAGLLSPEKLAKAERVQIEALIRPSGYFRQKAARLAGFAGFLLDHGGIDRLKKREADELRKLLLSVNGIGPETADSMLLYALDMPVFVVDAYTKRVFSRVGEVNANDSYAEVQHYFTERLSPSLPLFQEYHALIVKHAKEHCRVKPDCGNCPLLHLCAFGTEHVD